MADFFVCLMVNTITFEPFEMKFLSEQDMVVSSDEFEYGCIPMHCGALVMI